MDNFRERIRDEQMNVAEKMSVKSAKIKSSSHGASEHSTILLKKQMSLDANRARLKYIEREANLKKKRAEIEADLHVLEQRKEIAATEAEVQCLEIFDTYKNSIPSPSLCEPIDKKDFTEKYVDHQTKYKSEHDCKEEVDIDGFANYDLYQSNYVPQEHGAVERNTCKLPVKEACMKLNPEAKIFQPVSANDQQQSTVMSGLTQFLLKKDLLLNRFNKFNDKPESYSRWKASFLSIVQELKVDAFDQLDLLVKWLGPESSKYASSMHASSMNDPGRGVTKVWERLDQRFGSPEMVEAALKAKLENFPKLVNNPKDNKRLYELSDILFEIESNKENPKYAPLLAHYDSSSGILPIVNKLPHNIQEKWTTQAVSYKKRHDVPFPPFSFFVSFINEISRIKNDPGFQYETHVTSLRKVKDNQRVVSRKVEFSQQSSNTQDVKKCPIHKSNHLLKDCRTFRAKPIVARRKLLKENKICFRCCESTEHLAKNCKAVVKCMICGSNIHCSALHVDDTNSFVSQRVHGGERESIDSRFKDQVASKDVTKPNSVSTKCTEICKGSYQGKSCAKTLLVRVYPQGHPENSVQLYAIIDDQSNRSLARSKFFDLMGIDSEQEKYTLSSCSGVVSTSGRRASGYLVESLDRLETLKLPTLIECDEIPNVREEIPTPEIARYHSHLTDLESHIPPLDENADIMLLIGRDLIEAHHVLDQRIGQSSPYAQQLRLGWVLIGESCLKKAHAPNTIYVNKSHFLSDGRASILKPCSSNFKVKDLHVGETNTDSVSDSDYDTVLFKRTPNDNKPALSTEDREFIRLMDEKDQDGRWVAPLPFRNTRRRLPNKKPLALKRATILRKTLQKDEKKKEHFFTFMQGIFENKHAEIAPPLKDDDECWYLPVFGVYNPKKPSKIRVVFDSSAKFDGICLNDVLLTGPDLTNNLLSVLLRFRKEAVAITADIQQLFFGFIVSEEHRNFLRFLWHKDNKPEEDLVEYRMREHVFGNAPSPAVATYGLRKSVTTLEKVQQDVVDFVHNNFYVDDALASLPTADEAIDLMRRTQNALREGGNLRLHKIASNNMDVMNAFCLEDSSADLMNLNLSEGNVPLQRSLGLFWNIQSDTFTFKVSLDDKPFTRRGILSTLNSIFDPLGFVAPAVLKGRLMFRTLMDISNDWDEPLPSEHERSWQLWKDSLQDLVFLDISRTYVPVSLRDSVLSELHVFSDASESAVAAVAYIKATNLSEESYVGYALGKAKVAPRHGHTIPRLELCAAVLASDIAQTLIEQLDISFSCIQFYTDSKVVLGYLYNRTRRFYTYVSNRVEKVLNLSRPEQWHYVSSENNPADIGTRGVHAKDLQKSVWLCGPSFLSDMNTESDNFGLVDADNDVEIRPCVNALKSETTLETRLGSDKFKKFSSWNRLVRASAQQKSFRSQNFCTADFHDAELLVIREAQHDFFRREILNIKQGQPLSKDSTIVNLNPFLDKDGMLRVGGRLNLSEFEMNQKNPVIIPKHCHVATLLIRHYHHKVKHQGRHLTEGSIRSAGYWIIGGKKLVSSEIYKCVICRKLRGQLQHQQMADLPDSRLHPSPPFSYVGVDTFGHWNIVSRRTRGGIANSKRWAILFTCLVTRAIHIEIVEEMSTSSFINALRRFISIRGKVIELRSDKGTNFIGSTDSLRINAINVEDKTFKCFLFENGTRWIFNPPHSSHMGGAWERMIGIARKILDALALEIPMKSLTHEVLVTFMAEVCAIVNSRPIVPVSSDPDHPAILSPSILLTQKEEGDVSPFENFDIKQMYKAQWKHVQILADRFWKRWRVEYVQSLQVRRKWQVSNENVKKGDVVILKEKDVRRNEWPVGVVENAIVSHDGKVRKVELRIVKNNQPVVYSRPVTEIVLLCSQ